MVGDKKCRYCASCGKNVYNLAAMSRVEAQELIVRNEGHLCIQLYRRGDGSVITNDCPVGMTTAHRSTSWVGNFLITALAAILGAVGIHTVMGNRVKNTFVSGGAVAITTNLIDPGFRSAPHDSVVGE